MMTPNPVKARYYAIYRLDP